MFPYPCPSCSQRLLAPADRAGQRTICPKCLRPLTIPQPDSMAMEDPKTLFDPSEIPIPVLANTDTPFPGTIPVSQYAGALASGASETRSGHAELRAVATSGDLTFDLPEVAAQDRASVSDTGFPRPSETVTPPPNPAKLPIRTRRSTNPDARGMVMLNPTGLFSVDVAAELSAALSMRMKPPPELSMDRRLVVGAWAFGTLAALGLWLAGLFYNAECLPFVALLGAALLAFGIIWRACLVGHEESVLQGMLCLLPPVLLVRLFQKAGENGLRPLGFAASGAAVLALFGTAATARSFFGNLSAATEPSPENRLGSASGRKLRSATDDPKRLQFALAEIDHPETARTSTAEEKAEVIGELRRLLGHEQQGLRITALSVLHTWTPSEANDWALSALRGETAPALRTALGAAGTVNSPEIIAAIAEHLRTREYRPEAQSSLVAIGPAAEGALLERLTAPEEAFALSVLDVLTQIGAAKSLAAFRQLAATSESALLKSEADSAAKLLAGKLEK